jgi:hypothetical protein
MTQGLGEREDTGGRKLIGERGRETHMSTCHIII